MAQHYIASQDLTIKLACTAFRISGTYARYQALQSSENWVIADWFFKFIEDETDRGRCVNYLHNVECFKWDHKRVYRIDFELALDLRIRYRRRLKRNKPEPLKQNQVCFMDCYT